MKEIELIDKFSKYLVFSGFEFKRELRKGSYHNEGYVDIVIKNEGILVGIEAKLLAHSSVISQACRNCILFPYNYILVPKISERMKKKCKKYGIGVIIPDSNDAFIIIQKPGPARWYLSKTRYFKMLRNWIQNRIGRPIDLSSKEIPENYSQENLDKIKCNYDWIGKEFDQYSVDWKGMGFKIYPKKKEKSEKYTKSHSKTKTLFDYFN